MGNIANGVGYWIMNPSTGNYLRLEGENVISGGDHPHDDDYVFTAIQTPDMRAATDGNGYALQPFISSNYVNCQFMQEPPAENYWAAVADVLEIYVFNLAPHNEDDPLNLSNNETNLFLTMPEEDNTIVRFEAESSEKSDRQKWIFVRRDGNTDPA